MQIVLTELYEFKLIYIIDIMYFEKDNVLEMGNSYTVTQASLKLTIILLPQLLSAEVRCMSYLLYYT